LCIRYIPWLVELTPFLGTDGPINISRSYRGAAKAEDDLLAAAKVIGLPEIPDLQDFKSCDGVMRWYRYVGPDGTRQDAAHRYIHPLLQDGNHKNLHLLLDTIVSRVLVDENKRATGVEYTSNPSRAVATSLSDKPEAATGTVKARKLVVVASGTMGTPRILERSGVGQKALLEKLNISVVADSPGVGEAYQDHHLLLYPYKTNLSPTETVDGVLSGRLDFVKAMEEKNPILSWNSIDVAGKLRPSDEDVKSLGPAFEKAWKKDYANIPSKPLFIFGALNGFFGDPSLVKPGQYATMAAFTGYPYSRGSIHINTTDVRKPDGYDFDNGFLSDEGDFDLLSHIWVYKIQRDMYRRTYAYRGELELGHPQFPEGSKAALLDLEGKESLIEQYGSREKVPTLEYDKEDDKAIEEFVRQNLQTTWHSIGTCAMRPFKDGGVVDKDLNVYGVEGLKLAGESISRLIHNSSSKVMELRVLSGGCGTDCANGW
jgi:alcohol oxidase